MIWWVIKIFNLLLRITMLTITASTDLTLLKGYLTYLYSRFEGLSLRDIQN